jgi:hypothetical protein
MKVIPQLRDLYSLLQKMFTFLAALLKDGICSQEKEQSAAHLRGCALQDAPAETARLMQ